MIELLASAQIRSLEMAAIDSGRVSGLELMERAGRGVVDAVFEEWPELAKGAFNAVVLYGPGNNGGDRFVAARLLQEEGWDVDVFLFGDAETAAFLHTECALSFGAGLIAEDIPEELPKVLNALLS